MLHSFSVSEFIGDIFHALCINSTLTSLKLGENILGELFQVCVVKPLSYEIIKTVQFLAFPVPTPFLLFPLFGPFSIALWHNFLLFLPIPTLQYSNLPPFPSMSPIPPPIPILLGPTHRSLSSSTNLIQYRFELLLLCLVHCQLTYRQCCYIILKENFLSLEFIIFSSNVNHHPQAFLLPNSQIIQLIFSSTLVFNFSFSQYAFWAIFAYIILVTDKDYFWHQNDDCKF